MKYKYKEVLSKLREKGFIPKKHLGQNFLIDRNIAEFIVRSASVAGENVLEVGGGLGALTEPLSVVSRKLIVVEKDPYLYEYLKAEFSNSSKVKILCMDVMDVDLRDVFRGEEYIIVSNLPYSITSPFLFKIWDTEPPVKEMVLMVQYDVALRIVGARKEDRGPLYVLYSLTHKVDLLKKIPVSVFVPRPKVDSAILKFIPVERINPELKPCLRRIVDCAYRYRRKKLAKALSIEIPHLNWKEILTNLGVDPELRAEDLEPDRWKHVALSVSDLL